MSTSSLRFARSVVEADVNGKKADTSGMLAHPDGVGVRVAVDDVEVLLSVVEPVIIVR